ADHDAHVVDARGVDRLEPVEQHRLVRHRDELLGAGVRDGAQARAAAAGQHQGLHVPSASASRRSPSASAAPTFAGSFAPASARCGLPPPDPPATCATFLTRSEALSFFSATRSSVTAARNVVLSPVAIASTAAPRPS